MNSRVAALTAVTLSLAYGVGPAARLVRNRVFEAGRQRAFEAYGRLPLSFERNQGQAPAEAAFVARGSGYTLLLLRSSST